MKLIGFTNHPVALSQIITDGMAQVVDRRNLCEYRGKTLGSTIHQWSVAGNVIAANTFAHITLFIITTINASIQIIQIQFGDNRFQFIEFFALLSAERGHQFFKSRKMGRVVMQRNSEIKNIRISELPFLSACTHLTATTLPGLKLTKFNCVVFPSLYAMRSNIFESFNVMCSLMINSYSFSPLMNLASFTKCEGRSKGLPAPLQKPVKCHQKKY